MKFPSRGLYAITKTEEKTSDSLIAEVASAIKGGACIIQYRDKLATDQQAFYCATKLQALCKQHKIPLIINDDVELACRVNADGVHLGKDDGSIALARKRLGLNAIIGLSCYNNIDLAKNAASEGADYVAFGRFFPSTSKPLAAPADVETLTLAKKQIKVPIVAIGGILPENGQQLLDYGADILAVIGGVFAHDPEQSAFKYQKLFTH